jgi:AraC-like DNA-binding protein
VPRHARVVAKAAPRYDVRLLEALRALDDRDEPIAEISRRAGSFAERLGVPRPSYVHVRRLVQAQRLREDEERERRAAIRRIALDVAEDLIVGRRVNAYEVADRVADVRRETLA